MTLYDYQVNFTVEFNVCHYFIRLSSKEIPPNIESMIEQNILPIRSNRNYTRQHRFQKSMPVLLIIFRKKLTLTVYFILRQMEICFLLWFKLEFTLPTPNYNYYFNFKLVCGTF